MFCSDLLEGAVCYLFIYGVGICVFVYSFGVSVVKPTLIFLIISGGSQGFCSMGAGQPHHIGENGQGMDGAKPLTIYYIYY